MARSRREPVPLVRALGHLVLTGRDVGRSCEFYERTLGMERLTFNGRFALRFGQQKINLHEAGHEFEPKAARPVPGSADLCFVTDLEPQDVIAHLTACGVAIEEGPVERSGALGPITSLYLRDPDGNLLELAAYG